MTDYFALLNEPRRPWLEPDKFKQKFLALSAEVHPDRTHNASPAEKDAAQQRYTELNAAYRCLGDPKERLRHLLKLELGANPKDVERIPQALMNLFLEVSQLCRHSRNFKRARHAYDFDSFRSRPGQLPFGRAQQGIDIAAVVFCGDNGERAAAGARGSGVEGFQHDLPTQPGVIKKECRVLGIVNRHSQIVNYRRCPNFSRFVFRYRALCSLG